MKNKKIKNFILIILIFFVILFIIIFSNLKMDFFQNDILFLKFLGNIFTSEQDTKEIKYIGNTQKKDTAQQYIFDITYKYMNFTNVNLIDTIKSNTLVNEKIAPGISGEFDVVVKTNRNSKYQIYFISQNEKPQNLEFKIANTNISVNKIEDLAKYLTGTLEKGQTRTVTIEWSWNYENDTKGNIQDTKDAKNIDEYIFDIYTYGEQVIT